MLSLLDFKFIKEIYIKLLIKKKKKIILINLIFKRLSYIVIKSNKIKCSIV